MELEIFEFVSHGLFVVSIEDGNIVYCNRTGAKLLGYRSQQLVNKKFVSLFIEPDRQHIDKLLSTTTLSMGSRTQLRDFDRTMTRRSGRKVHVELYYKASKIDGDKVVVISVQDTTEIQRARVEANTNRRFKDIVESLPEAFFIFDATWQCTAANRAATTMLELTEDEIVGRSFESLIKPKDKNQQWVDQECGWEALIIGANQPKEVLVSCSSPLEGTSIQAVIATDISKLKALERLVHDQQSDLAESEKWVAVGEMSAGVAHEIRNPLAIIKGRVDLLSYDLDAVLSKTQHNHFKSIDRMIERITTIIAGMNYYTSDTAEEDIGDCSLRDAFDEAMDFCEARIKQLEIRMEVAPVPNEHHVKIQAGKMSQVIVNLLNNASEAVANLGVSDRWIRIDFQETASSIEMTVANGGPNIPDEFRDQIFTPFHKTQPPGTGTVLGISLSKGILESRSGGLQLEDGDTPTFKATIPIVTRLKKAG